MKFIYLNELVELKDLTVSRGLMKQQNAPAFKGYNQQILLSEYVLGAGNLSRFQIMTLTNYN